MSLPLGSLLRFSKPKKQVVEHVCGWQWCEVEGQGDNDLFMPGHKVNGVSELDHEVQGGSQRAGGAVSSYRRL